MIGILQCVVKGFEGDLDGIDANSMVTFEWTFSDSKSCINVSHSVLRRCGYISYKGSVHPPWQVRTAACVVRPLVEVQVFELVVICAFG